MLRTIFSPDNPVWRFFILVGRIWWLNILWLVCSLPIFTIGASTTALIYSCMKLKKDEGYPTENFFKSFKENFRQGTLLGIIYILAGALIGIGLIFWNHATIPGSKLAWAVVLCIGILYFISILYVFAIQSRFINPIKDTIRYSILMAFTNFKETIFIGLIVIGLVLANLFSMIVVTFVTVNIGLAIVIYLMAMHYEEVFKKYMPEPEVQESYLDVLEREVESGKKKKRYR
ncbi:MAG: DUF624 domain-containing protein [Eubacterium sp.]|nr:DUF624 domain-containing protein [Eubacterium sp.]